MFDRDLAVRLHAPAEPAAAPEPAPVASPWADVPQEMKAL